MNIALIAFVAVPVGVVILALLFVTRQYKRCPSNKILVIFGRVGGKRASKCLHGGGLLIIPLLQDYAYLSLEPLAIDIELSGALSKKNIRVNVPSTFTIGISTDQTIMYNAAERLLGLSEDAIQSQSRDIILGQLRLVIATLSIEEINQDREKFLTLVNENVTIELNKIGLEVINVNIRDITDESGYIDAIGKRAAAVAINTAKVEVAEADKMGSIGEATARTEKDVTIAQQQAKIEQGKKEAESQQRVFISAQEADAVKGENDAKANIALYDAELMQKKAEANRRGEIAAANSTRDILKAEKEQRIAQLEKETLANEEIEKRRIEISADAEAEKRRRIAQGEADATLKKYTAEAKGIQMVLEAKAVGYQKLIQSCGDQKHLAPTLLMVEKLPELVEQQVKAIQNLKIDKITVWDSGAGSKDGSGGSTANFIKSLVTSVPALHDLAQQVGIELPSYLGKFVDVKSADSVNGKESIKSVAMGNATDSALND